MKDFLVLELPEEAKAEWLDAQSYTIHSTERHEDVAVLNVFEYGGRSSLVTSDTTQTFASVREALQSFGPIDEYDLPDFLFEQLQE
jgi:hypothetical protein